MKAAMLALTVVSIVHARPVIDGTVDHPESGAALCLQNTNTQFGNAGSGDPINCGGGSEVNAVYATISSGRLHVMVTGIPEPNFNKLEVFIDSVSGGMDHCCGDLPL